MISLSRFQPCGCKPSPKVGEDLNLLKTVFSSNTVDKLTFKVTTVRLPEETIEDLENLTDRLQRDRSDIMREALQIGIGEMKLRLAIELYAKGKISFGRMTELTGLGYRELSLELKRRNVPLRYGEERFDEEVEKLVG